MSIFNISTSDYVIQNYYQSSCCVLYTRYDIEFLINPLPCRHGEGNLSRSNTSIQSTGQSVTIYLDSIGVRSVCLVLNGTSAQEGEFVPTAGGWNRPWRLGMANKTRCPTLHTLRSYNVTQKCLQSLPFPHYSPHFTHLMFEFIISFFREQ